MEKSLIDFKTVKEKFSKNRARVLKAELYDFLDNLPTQWEGGPHICKFMRGLGNKHYFLSEILYAIGEEQHLFFWCRIVVGSLSLREFDQLIQTLREEFIGENRLINEMEFFFLSHQKKLLKEITAQVESQQNKFHSQNHEGTA